MESASVAGIEYPAAIRPATCCLASCVLSASIASKMPRTSPSMTSVPLFYPTAESEVRDMFVALARKLQSRLAPEDIPPTPRLGQLSGADIEGLVGRALRLSLLAGKDAITRESLAEVVAQFLPSTQGLEKEMQETAAILECTDRQFLPPAIAQQLDARGRGELQQRFAELRRLVDGT